jgi:AmpD protein
VTAAYQIINHRIDAARQYPSPHAGPRPDSEISLIVLHCISLPAGHFGGRYVQELFMGQLSPAVHPDFSDLTDVRVSAHLFIRRTGGLSQFVAFDQCAWHAGESSYQGRPACNDYSIGIELEGTDTSPFNPIQYEVLQSVVMALQHHYRMPKSAVVGHAEVAPGRKTDPGVHFDWKKFRRGG